MHRRQSHLRAVADQREQERQSQALDARAPGRGRTGTTTSDARSANRARLLAAKYRKSVPTSAIVTPNELMMMYFHAASSETGLALETDQHAARERARLDQYPQQPEVSGLERGKHHRGEDREEDEVEPDLQRPQLAPVLLRPQVGGRPEARERHDQRDRREKEAAQRVDVDEPAERVNAAPVADVDRERDRDRERGQPRTRRDRSERPRARRSAAANAGASGSRTTMMASPIIRSAASAPVRWPRRAAARAPRRTRS